VVGDRTSSNARRLGDASRAMGTPAYLIRDLAELQNSWLAEASVVGISAGASTPEHLVAEVVDHFHRNGADVLHETVIEEHISFGLPPEVVPRARPHTRPTHDIPPRNG